VIDLNDPNVVAVATALTIVAGGIAVVEFTWKPIRGLLHRHDPPVATRPDIDELAQQIKDLEQKVTHPPEYLDGLPEAVNETLRAAYQEARILQLEGYQAQSVDKHREASERFTRALALADTDSQRAALRLLRGQSLHLIGDSSGATQDLEAALLVSERIPLAEEADRARAAALGNLGLVYARRGDLERAEEHHKASLEMNRRVNNPAGEAAALGNLGNVYADRGDLERAEEHHKQALEIDRRIDNPLGQAQDLGNLGNVYASRGDLERAEEHHKQALEINRRIDNPEAQANALANLGLLAAQRGRTEEARRVLREALALYERIGAGGVKPDTVRAALQRLEEAGGEEKPRRRARKRKDKEPPAG